MHPQSDVRLIVGRRKGCVGLACAASVGGNTHLIAGRGMHSMSVFALPCVEEDVRARRMAQSNPGPGHYDVRSKFDQIRLARACCAGVELQQGRACHRSKVSWRTSTLMQHCA